MKKSAAVTIGVATAAMATLISTTAVLRHRATVQQRAREELLRADLNTLRGAIRRYRTTHGAPPHTLQEAVTVVPADPVTGRADTWRLTMEETVTADDFEPGALPARRSGIVDVHSGATGADATGKRWSEY